MRTRSSAFAAALLLSATFTLSALAADPAAVPLHWLDGAPPSSPTAVSFGVPWPQGQMKKDQPLAIRVTGGAALPAQSWPLAYWPDGSLKWSGIATVAPANESSLEIRPADAAAPMKTELTVENTTDAFTIHTGPLTARIPKTGRYFIDSLTLAGHDVARHAQLTCIDQTAPETDHLSTPPRVEYFSEIRKVTLEQSGPVRAVVKIEGIHQRPSSFADGHPWLPFTIRLYFYAGQTPIRMVHTIVFDGDKDHDFIRGLGVTFDVPMREQSQNRHVRFANSNGGVWAEPLQLLVGRRGGGGGGGRAFGSAPDRGPNQIEGDRLPNSANPPEAAEWDEFRLVQPNSEGFDLEKRTNSGSSWVEIGEGRRASGTVFIGDVTGGLGLGVQNFWQSHPTSLEIDHALSDTAHLTAWLWSPDGPAMDMRHYDTHGHGNVKTSGSYEDYEPAFATPVGVARTSELTLFPEAATPTREAFAAEAQVASDPPVMTVTPQTLHDAGVFGIWSLPDRSTPYKRTLEEHLDAGIDYYEKSIDQQHWYGFWNFGDVRHAYDPQRHEWRYDIGGFAWDNSELGSVLWLWESYIRTGRADIYKMARAMIRHTSEVDTYHLGEFAGLGSRHNVSHWGDSAKEARVSQSAHAQFMYFLTTDERLGDIITAEANVDEVASKLDPMRKAQPITKLEKKYPGRIRFGPDWLGFAGNWMIEWERTGDPKWRDKIMAGVNSLYAMPFWARTGKNEVMGYDYHTGKLYAVDDHPGIYNLTTIQGGAEVAFELTPLLHSDEWSKIWLQYCRLGAANAEMLTRDKQTGNEGSDASFVGEQGGGKSQGAPRLAAYAYAQTHNPAYAQRAIQALANLPYDRFTTRRIEGSAALNPMDEAPTVSTNGTAQWSLMAIEILQLCADRLPQEVPAPTTTQSGPGGRNETAPADTAPGQ